MNKLIINIDDDIEPDEACYKVAMVIQGGLVSKTSKGKQYCFGTRFKDGVMVAATKIKTGHSFRVYKC